MPAGQRFRVPLSSARRQPSHRFLRATLCSPNRVTASSVQRSAAPTESPLPPCNALQPQPSHRFLGATLCSPNGARYASPGRSEVAAGDRTPAWGNERQHPSVEPQTCHQAGTSSRPKHARESLRALIQGKKRRALPAAYRCAGAHRDGGGRHKVTRGELGTPTLTRRVDQLFSVTSCWPSYPSSRRRD